MNGDIGCALGPGSRNCWVPVGKTCRQTPDLNECKLPGIMGYYTQEECFAAGM